LNRSPKGDAGYAPPFPDFIARDRVARRVVALARAMARQRLILTDR
jgi:hypothetical protein